MSRALPPRVLRLRRDVRVATGGQSRPVVVDIFPVAPLWSVLRQLLWQWLKHFHMASVHYRLQQLASDALECL